jgi:hypothetical protein
MTASFRLLAALGACALLAACPSSKPPGLTPDGSGLPLESVTPPIEGADPRVLQHVEVMGDSVYLDAGSVAVSFDKRRTWKELNAQALGSIQKWVFVTPTSGIALTGKHGLAYIELDTDVISSLNNEPAWSAWGLRGDGTLFTVRMQVEDPSLEVGDETARVWLGRRRDFNKDAPWPEVELPRLPFSHRKYLPSVHFGANGELYVASYFGLQVSRDDGQTWQQVPVAPDEQGSLSWSGIDLFVTRAGTLFAREQNTTFVSRDGGASWAVAPMPGGPANRTAMMRMEEPVPGELHFRDLPYRSTDEGRTFQRLFTLERYGTDRTLETLFYRGGEYYLHLALLGNFVSAAPDESLTLLNPPKVGHLTPGNLHRAFPLGGGRFLGLWNEGLITYTPGDIGWKVERFFPGAYFLEKLRDGRLALAERMGVRFSRDEGATWSEPAPVSKTTTNSVLVKALVATPGRLFLSGVDKSHCDERALLESRDDGASWQLVTPQLILDPKQSPVTGSHQPELTTADLDGQLLGYATDLFNCREDDVFTATSENQGLTWVGTRDRLPLAVTSRNNLLAIDDTGHDEAILLWNRSQGAWQSFGPPKAGGETLVNLFVPLPFIHVDGADHVYFTDGLRLYRSAAPVN